MQSLEIKKADTVIQEKMESIVTKSLKKFNVSTYKQTLSRRLFEFMEDISNRPISKAELDSAVEEFGEKNVISYVFSGDRGSYYDTVKAFNDESYERELIKDGLHPLFVTEEDAKMYHSVEHIGTHSQVINTNNTRIGTAHGKESVASNGLVYDLFKSRVLIELTAEGLMEHVFQEYNRVITKPIATKIVDDINKQRKIFEGRIFTGELGDDELTKRALRKVKKHCIDNQTSFETSDYLGQKARKMSHDISRNLGTEIGNIVLNEQGLDNADIIARFAKKLCTALNVPVEDAGALMTRPLKKAKK